MRHHPLLATVLLFASAMVPESPQDQTVLLPSDELQASDRAQSDEDEREITGGCLAKLSTRTILRFIQSR